MFKEAILAIISPITNIIKGRQEAKREKQAAKDTVTRIFADATAKDATVSGQIALYNAQNASGTWKDEYALLVITGPVVIGMLAGALEAIGFAEAGTTKALMTGMFAPLAAVPEWWQLTFNGGIWAALGVNQLKKALRP